MKAVLRLELLNAEETGVDLVARREKVRAVDAIVSEAVIEQTRKC